MKQLQKWNTVEKLLLGLCILTVCILFVYTFTLGNLYFHSDSASINTLVNEQLQQGRFFPDGWYSATGISKVPLFLLLPQAILKHNWLLARDIAQAFMSLLMLAAIVFFGKTVFKNRAWVLFLLLLASYLSECQYDMLYLQCAYTSSVIMVFGLFAVFVRFAEAERGKGRVIWGAFYGGILFFFCLFGIVTLESVTIPMVGAIMLLYLCKHPDEKPADALKQKKLWGVILVLCMVSLVGVIVNLRVLEPLANVRVENNALTRFAPFEELLNGIMKVICGFLYYIGIQTGVSFFSLPGILNFIRIGLMLPMTLIFPVLEIRQWKKLPKEKQLFVFYVIIYTVETLLILLCGNEGIAHYTAAGRYELTMIVLLNALGCDYVYETYLKNERLISWVYGLIACCFLVITLPIMNGISTYPAQMQNMRGLTDYLQENDLNYGYATFWNAGKNTVLSNGDVQINGILLGNGKITPFLWLSSENWYEPDAWQDETFLLLTEEEWRQLTAGDSANTVYGTPERELQYGGYRILTYDYNIAENNFCGKIDGTRNYLPTMCCSNEAMRQSDGSVQIASGDVLYGPYISMDSGSYQMSIDLTEPTEITVTSDCGGNVIGTYAVTPENNQIDFTLLEDTQNVEFVIRGGNQAVTVTGIYLQGR